MEDMVCLEVESENPVCAVSVAALRLEDNDRLNVVTIVILSRGKCGLSKTVTRYLLAMSAADLTVVFLDVIMMKIPKAFPDEFSFLFYVRVCRTHVFLLQAATDCSVWFTVAFTFDRFVAICFQDLNTTYCTGRTAAVVLSTLTVLSSLKNVFWFFMVQDIYTSSNIWWPCMRKWELLGSLFWTVIDVARSVFSTVIPFLVVILLNVFTITNVLLASKARDRLRASSNGQSSRDPEMQSRRKSLVLLLVISGNFILLWALYVVTAIWNRMAHVVGPLYWLTMPSFFTELCYMLQLLSCCTNTVLYAVSQTKFRQQLKQVLNSPLTLIWKRIRN
ncbi:probable G-protein coupled receptor 139 [Mobula birostris]|uniref:probable G-protein coupled receptor 139 n=1 Tax=Mobula birostris TaxID=1983395 RepID=UPI003B286DFD